MEVKAYLNRLGIAPRKIRLVTGLVSKMNIDEANNWLMQKLERSWNKLSPEAKEIVKDKYEASKLLLGG